MGMAFLHGQNGGGNLLRLKVVGSTSAPSNPKENTIWVKTSVPILENQVFFNEQTSDVFYKGQGNGSVYIPFQAANYSYWASTGANIVFPKGNFVQFNVNFLGCKQLINDEWVNMDAYIYHGSSWIQFSSYRYYLFNNGDQCTAVTGGWNGSTTTTDGNTYLYCQVNSDKDMTRPSTKSTVPTSSYSKLCVECIPVSREGSGSSNFTCCVSNKASGEYITDYAKYAASLKDLTIGAEYTFEIDISGVTVDAYVRFTAYYSYMKYHRIWLE